MRSSVGLLKYANGNKQYVGILMLIPTVETWEQMLRTRCLFRNQTQLYNNRKEVNIGYYYSGYFQLVTQRKPAVEVVNT